MEMTLAAAQAVQRVKPHAEARLPVALRDSAGAARPEYLEPAVCFPWQEPAEAQKDRPPWHPGVLPHAPAAAHGLA